jgi:hypothetical protein
MAESYNNFTGIQMASLLIPLFSYLYIVVTEYTTKVADDGFNFVCIMYKPNRINMKTKLNTIKIKKGITLLALITGGFLSAQQSYDNFEGNSLVCYNVTKGGKIDTLAANPAPDKINGSAKCAKYTRNSKEKFDNIKMCAKGKLSDVTKFATYTGQPQVIKMKVYTTAPAGTLIELQLGKKDGPAYPDGVNSQYQAVTTAVGVWEEVEFKFSQTPQGSQTSFEDVDQITLLFNPNTNSDHVYYFDDLTGPNVLPSTNVSVPAAQENEKAPGTKRPATHNKPAGKK